MRARNRERERERYRLSGAGLRTARGNASTPGFVLSIVVLIALVALASRGNPISTVLREGYAERVELVVFVLLLFGIGAIATVAVAMLVHRRTGARRAEPLRATMVRALPLAAVTLSTLALLAIARIELELSAPPETLRVHLVPRGEPGGPFGFTDSRNPNVIASEDTTADDPVMLVLAPEPPTSNALARQVAAALGLLVLVLIAAAMWRAYAKRRAWRARAHADIDVSAAEQSALHGALVATIDAMLADPDPRTAIIGAYARLLDDFDAAGIGRLEHEAPMEHVQRALERVRVRPEPLRQLIMLFEIARFSSHRLAHEHREQALDALHAAAGDIAEAGDITAAQTATADDAEPIGASR